MIYVFLYLLCIILVNIGFEHVPLVELAGVMFPPMSLAVGIIFVVRDFAQKHRNELIVPAMLIGFVISYIMASPYVAIASATAFFVSEACDWAAYSRCKYNFPKRVLVSSLISTPLDSIVFLLMIGQLSLLAVLFMFLSKMVAAIAVYLMYLPQGEANEHFH